MIFFEMAVPCDSSDWWASVKYKEESEPEDVRVCKIKCVRRDRSGKVLGYEPYQPKDYHDFENKTGYNYYVLSSRKTKSGNEERFYAMIGRLRGESIFFSFVSLVRACFSFACWSTITLFGNIYFYFLATKQELEDSIRAKRIVWPASVPEYSDSTCNESEDDAVVNPIVNQRVAAVSDYLI